MKVVVNRAVGSRFAMSSAGLDRLLELKGLTGVKKDKSTLFGRIPRNDEHLVQVIEEFGSAASDENAELTVVEIPDNVSWKVYEVVGYEFIKVNENIF